MMYDVIEQCVEVVEGVLVNNVVVVSYKEWFGFFVMYVEVVVLKVYC